MKFSCDSPLSIPIGGNETLSPAAIRRLLSTHAAVGDVLAQAFLGIVHRLCPRDLFAVKEIIVRHSIPAILELNRNRKCLKYLFLSESILVAIRWCFHSYRAPTDDEAMGNRISLVPVLL